MSRTIEAVYENGVLKPISAVNIEEHAIVSLIIQEAKSIARATSGLISAKNKESVEQIALDPQFLPEEG